MSAIIGTTLFTWNPKQNGQEQYIGQLWYPTPKNGLKRARYLPDTVYESTELVQTSELLAMRSLMTDAAVDAPILTERAPYPILVFSPGHGMYRQVGTFMFEYLASRGFIVASVDHPGTSGFTELIKVSPR